MKQYRLVRCIKYELVRSMANILYPLKILLLVIVLLASQADLLHSIYTKTPLDGYDIAGIYNSVLHIDRFKIVVLVIIASIYTNSYCKDINHYYLKYIVTRNNLKYYIFSRYIGIFTSGIIAYACSTFIYIAILKLKLPLIASGFRMWGDSNFFTFEHFPLKEHPVLWIVLSSILFILSVLALCSAGFYLSLYWNDSFVVLCTPTILYFVFTSMAQFLPSLFYLPGYGNNIDILESGLWENYFFKVTVNISSMIIFMLLSYLKLRKKSYEGTI